MNNNEVLDKIKAKMKQFGNFFSKYGFEIIAIIISVMAWSKAEDVAKYQITQERLPRVVMLNQEIQTSFETELQFYDYTMVDISSLKEGIKIPIYNIGVGVAQNCTVKVDENSVKKACLMLKDQLIAESCLQIGSLKNLKQAKA